MDHGKLIQSKHLASAELILLVDIAPTVVSLYPLKKKLPLAHAVSTHVFVEVLRLSEGQAGGT
jgi:hypothetical protein